MQVGKSNGNIECRNVTCKNNEQKSQMKTLTVGTLNQKQQVGKLYDNIICRNVK